MPDVENQQQAPIVPAFDPFKTDVQQPAPDTTQQTAAATTDTTTTAQPAADAQAATPAAPEFKYVDVPDWLKENFGVDDVEVAKKEWEELRKLKEQQNQFKFDNPDNERVYSYVKEGKIPELRDFLNKQDRIAQLEKADPNNPSTAAEIIKAGMQLKSPIPLTQQQVDFLFNQNYAKPAKPNKGIDEEDADYSIRIAEWDQKVKDVDMKLNIDALMMQPEISKMKVDISQLPDIKSSQQTTQPAGPTQKELEDQQRYVDAYIKSVDDSLKTFNGYDVTFKDESVEIPISYVVTDQEKAALAQELKNFAQQNFDANALFADRWVKEDGTLNVIQMAQDKYVLNNLGKILQKVSNESGTKRLEHKLKVDSNITVNGGTSQKTFDPAQKSAMDSLAEAVWKS